MRLCNISPVGAMIEGQELPLVGQEIELRRGALAARGRIVWRSENLAGVSFSERTEVAEWFPEAEPQHSVDRTFQRITEEFRAREEPAKDAAIAPLHNSYITVDDMDRVAASLDELADALADDPNVIMRHTDKLQSLDIAAQLLRKLADQDKKIR